MLSKATINGICYASGLVLLIDVVDDVPVFGKIKNILYCSNAVLVLMVKLQVLSYVKHFCCFRVNLTDEHIVTLAGNKLGYHLFEIYKIDLNYYVCLRYKV